MVPELYRRLSVLFWVVGDDLNLVFLFLRRTSGLHCMINPLYLLWSSLFLIVEGVPDLANYGKGVFLHQRRNFSVTYHRCDRRWSSRPFGVHQRIHSL